EWFQLLGVSATEDHIVGFEGRDQALHDLLNMALPFLSPLPLPPSVPHVVLECAFLVVKPAQLQRFDDSIQYHGGAKAGAQSKEQHLAALVSSQGLHGRVVDDLNGKVECSLEIKPHPPGTKVDGFRHRLTAQNRPRKTD